MVIYQYIDAPAHSVESAITGRARWAQGFEPARRNVWRRHFPIFLRTLSGTVFLKDEADGRLLLVVAVDWGWFREFFLGLAVVAATGFLLYPTMAPILLHFLFYWSLGYSLSLWVFASDELRRVGNGFMLAQGFRGRPEKARSCVLCGVLGQQKQWLQKQGIEVL